MRREGRYCRIRLCLLFLDSSGSVESPFGETQSRRAPCGYPGAPSAMKQRILLCRGPVAEAD